MATVNVYLSFNGDCEEAFNFYKSVFGGEFSYVGKYKDMPLPDRELTDAEKEKIMHVGLTISAETMLLGCDMLEEFVPGNNFSICVTPESEDEGRKIFDALSEGGNIIMPLEKTFWNSLFGMVSDKFGICWMVDYALA
ncbi:MAG: VOC family protein [Bacteroidales bacterium]|jgi:PhnB protein|nr:VOC family protein [Bacteroidales bacterium]